MYFVCSIGIALVMFYGNHLIISGQMSAGSFASFVTSLLLLYKPVKDLGRTLTDLQSTFVALGRVFELFDLVPYIKNKQNPIKMTDLNSSIEFKNVDFEYVEGLPVIKGLNLKVNKGETLALVGNSGGGKSTVVNLLPRFYDIKNGSITFDGVDIRDLEISSLRKNISFVFQDNFLFSGTIRENILMGNEKATDVELNEVIKMAHLDEFLSTLEDGIDTYVGERGTSLSGGQRQRVAIARAMIKNAPIVILDEATSALDNESEAIVQKALDNLIKNKTVFVIAHRLSTIHNANRIAVINEGQLVELGTHEELIAIPDGNYKHLYEMQFNNSKATA
jgi:subfamily B ATP-binding cassette protein MsbA